MTAIFDLAKSVQLTRGDLEKRASAHMVYLKAKASGATNINNSDFQSAVVGALVRTVDGDLEEDEDADSPPSSVGATTSVTRNFKVGSIIAVLDISANAQEDDLGTECCFSVEYGDRRESVVELRSISKEPMERFEHEYFTGQCARFHFAGSSSEKEGRAPLGSSRLFLSTEELLVVRERIGKWTNSYAVKRNGNQQQQIQQQSTSAHAQRDELIRTLLQEKKQLQHELLRKDEVIRVQALKKHQDQESSNSSANTTIQELKEKNESLVIKVKAAEEVNTQAKEAVRKTQTRVKESLQLSVAVKDFLGKKGVKAQGTGRGNAFTTDDLIRHLESLE